MTEPTTPSVTDEDIRTVVPRMETESRPGDDTDTTDPDTDDTDSDSDDTDSDSDDTDGVDGTDSDSQDS